MNKRTIYISTLLFTCLTSCSCQNKDYYKLNMNTDYEDTTNLEDGKGIKSKVVLLLGQSNASGCSYNDYLQINTTEEEYQKFENGYENVLINYCIDDHNVSSNGNFKQVDLTCAYEGCFGPELGIADILNGNTNGEKVFIFKYTMSGYSLNYHWLYNQERAWIYDACIAFVHKYMGELEKYNYDAQIGAICWMQGESDTTYEKANKYFKNQTAFVNYLRDDLKEYASDKGIYFIDAGISNSPYCEPAYPIINEAKEKFATLSLLNIYFSTIDMGFTIDQEPEGNPDWGHYDSLSELALGRKFSEELLKVL
ncbi:MAG: sialate O-acetylesterase [Bacilli bacterium]